MSSGDPPIWLSWASFRPLLRGIAQRVLLLGPIILIFLIASGVLGQYFGVPELFWDPNWHKQALAGFSVTLLFAQICLIGFLLDAPKPWMQDLPQPAPPGWRRILSTVPYGIARVLVPEPAGDPEDVQPWRQLRWYLAVSWLPLLAGLLVIVLLHPEERWGFLVGMAAGLVAAALFVWLFQQWDTARAQLRLRYFVQRLPCPLVMVLVLLATLVVLLTAAYFVPALRPVVTLLLGLWVGLASVYAGEVRYQEVPEEHRWIHGLAAASFGLFFLVYQVLFLFCWLAKPELTALLLPPAVVLCVLLAQLVAAHGFFKFHFGAWYTAIAAFILAVGLGIAGLTSYRHQLRELDYAAASLVDLEAADFQMELVETSDPNRLARLQDSYNRFFSRYENHARFLGADQDKLTRQTKFQSAPEVQAEQKKLRAAMLALETKRLDNWKTKLGGKPKLALVSVTGGANRSAVWTAYTLTQLERELGTSGIPFQQHVRVITGASGGMVGASYFVATLPGAAGHGYTDAAAAKAFTRKLGKDALTPVTQRFLFFDLPGAFIPGGTTYDRGLALEEAWNSYLDGALEKSFDQLAQGEAEGWCPSLVLSPMIVEDGRRLLISNLHLAPLAETTGSFLTGPAGPPQATSEETGPQPRPKGRYHEERSRYSLTALEFFQLFPETWSKFKLSTAVRLNASFPYVSPVAALPTNPPRHAVDAAYYDNYGVNLAAWWISQNAAWIQENTSGVVVIQIRDAVSERQRLTPMIDPAKRKIWDLREALEGVIGPALGASEGLQAIMSFRNDELLQLLSDKFNGADKKDVPFFTTVVFEFPAEVAMSWYLSDAEIERAMTGFEPGTANDRALAGLRSWFKQ
jgi:uncharacterized membrane protein YeaQ/YmgE (transglycosylase-associated protein family)